MENLSPNLSDNMEGFHVEKINYKNYEPSFRRWLVSEIDSGRMTLEEARERFKLPVHFSTMFRQNWQPRYSDELHLSLQAMNSKERADNKALEKRIKELEKQLELAQMKNVGLNTMIDIAEQDYKLEIRKKSGPKQ
jgi:hypothetical protein